VQFASFASICQRTTKTESPGVSANILPRMPPTGISPMTHPSESPASSVTGGRVNSAIAEYLRTADAGQSIDLGVWFERYPDVADELRQFLQDNAAFADRAAPLLSPDPSTRPESRALTDSICKSFGDFEILEELGRGGMGVVYRARQKSLNRVVALKMVLSGRFASDREMDRFRLEAEAAAGLDHPNIVSVYEVGECDGQPCFAMRLIEGGSLAARADELSGRYREVSALVAMVARAIHHAHQQGILHRDLKPSNILLDKTGIPHVTDFGLARRLGLGPGVSASTGVVGTPAYMAPEQVRGDKGQTTATDVYGLGGILYFLLTGSAPFRADSPMESLLLVLESNPLSPRKIRSDVPRDLEIVCLACLAKDPAQRYGSAQAVADELERVVRGEPIARRRAGRLERVIRWSRRRPTHAAMYGLSMLAIVLALTGGGVYGLWQRAEAARGDAVQARGEAETAQQVAEEDREKLRIEKGETENARAQLAIALDKLARVEYGRTMQVAYQMWRESNIPATLALLESARVDLRGWEWHYLHRLCRSDLLTLKGHTGLVSSASISPDGSRIVTTSNDRTARVWDAKTGAPALTFKGHTGLVRWASFNSDGLWVVTGSTDQTAIVWDTVTGAEVLKLKGHTAAVNSVSFSRDGLRVVTGSSDCTAMVWDALSGARLVKLSGHTSNINSTSFGPDGSRVVTTSGDNTAIVWDAVSGARLLTLKGHTVGISSASFSPDGSRVATGSSDQTAKVWDAKNGAELLTLKGHTGIVLSATFNPDGSQVATGSTDQTAKVWDALGDAGVITLKGHENIVKSASFSPDGLRAVTASTDRTAKIWDVKTQALAFTLKGHTSIVSSASFSPDESQIVTGGGDKTARVWDVKSGTELFILRGHTSGLSSTSFSADGSLIITGSGDKTAKVWDVKRGTELLTLKGHTGPVSSAAFSPDGLRAVTGSFDSTAKVWDAKSGAEILTLKGDTNVVLSVSFSPDGSQIVTGGGDSTAKVWDAKSGVEVFILKGHTKAVSSISFSPDGSRIVTGSHDNTAKVWDAKSGAEVLTLKGHSGFVSSVSFSRDGSRILTAGHDREAKVWDAGVDAITAKALPLKP
jgi:WD40 repeat protein